MQDGDEGFDANLSTELHQMQTLPNIDINIKCGNSLINHIDISSTLETFWANLNQRYEKSEDMFAKQELEIQKNDTQKKFNEHFTAAKEANSLYKNSSGNAAKAYKTDFEMHTNYLKRLFERNCNWHIDFYLNLREFFRNYGYKNIEKYLNDEQSRIIQNYIHEFEFQKNTQFERDKDRPPSQIRIKKHSLSS